MYMLHTVCLSQLAEAVCQRCSYEKVICEAHAKNIYIGEHPCHIAACSCKTFCKSISVGLFLIF